jgi:hypothetical protein
MKLLSVAFLSALAATAAAESVELSDFYVDKFQDYMTRGISVHEVSFTLNGHDAKDVTCKAKPYPYFPTSTYPCSVPEYHFAFTEGDEGSGLEFGVSLYYNNKTYAIVRGEESIVSRCYPNTEIDEEARYNCQQLLPTTIELKCEARCNGWQPGDD